MSYDRNRSVLETLLQLEGRIKNCSMDYCKSNEGRVPLNSLSGRTAIARKLVPNNADATQPPVSQLDASQWQFLADPACPLNWSTRRKLSQVIMGVFVAFTSSLGASIVTASFEEFRQQFHVDDTQAVLPLSLYAFALGIGPVSAGPLSETIGRWWVFFACTLSGALFTMGVAVCHDFAGICILRFLAGFCLGPNLAVTAGTLNDCFTPAKRGIPSAILVSMTFIGPGIAPLIGAYVTTSKGWRWTQWTLSIFLIFSWILVIALGSETYHPRLKLKRARQLGFAPTPAKPLAKRLQVLVTITLVRPLHMMVTEPIVLFLSLFHAINFATLFVFFTAIDYVFATVYHFSLNHVGLVFLSLVVGSLLALLTISLCDIFLYRKRAVSGQSGSSVFPEHRLYAAMIGSLGPVLSLFWFGWSAKPGVSWASPAIAIVPFAWGNVCVFVSLMQYGTDCYVGTTTASVASASSFARYTFGGTFPLFTLQMYEKLGIGWASSVLGFISLAAAPLPFILFVFGEQIRQRSKYETAT